MKKVYITLCALLLIVGNATAQDYYVIQRLIILKVVHNEEDFSEHYRARNARLVFYGDKEGNTYLANEQDNSASFGEIHLIDHEHNEQTDDYPAFTVFRFLWAYENTYDDRTGFCLIKLRLSYHEPATTFEMMMVTDDFDVSGYKGYEEKI
ncbi:MAG: hypothetical protein LUF87_04685 [Alistipes sp.]|nr:hypothetical protein [Alistipes sp.]